MIYKKAPIKNVICEFRPLQEPEGWSDVFIGQIYDKLKDVYPNKKDIVSFFKVMNNTTISIEQKKETKMEAGNKNYILVSQQRLAYCLEQEYQGWQVVKPQIMKAWQTYNEFLQPKELQQITLKYYNEIQIPLAEDADQLVEQDYFTVYANYNDIQASCIRPEIDLTFKYTDNQYLTINLIALSQVEPEKAIKFLFELNYIIDDCKDLSENNISELLENAHFYIENVFENSITDKLRKDIFERCG